MGEQSVSTTSTDGLSGERARRSRRPAHGRNPRRSLLEWFLVLLTVGTLLGAGVAGLVVLSEREFSRRIYPNVSIRGVGVGGMLPEAARNTLKRSYGAFLNNPVEIRFAGQSWWPTAEDLGLELDFDTALDEAFAMGRGGTRGDNLRSAAAVWEYGIDLPLRLKIDQTRMQSYLLTVAAQIEAPPQNADLQLRAGQVLQTPELWGVQVLVDDTVAEITAAAQSLEPQPVDLRTRMLAPRLRDADIAPLAGELQTLLGAPIVLQSPTSRCAPLCRWAWGPDRIAEWLRLRHTTDASGHPAITLSIDQTAIRSALLPVASALREEGTLPRVDWNNGALQITTPGDPGRGLDADQALAQINAALYAPERLIDLPLMPLPPPVNETNLASLGITQQVGLGISSFARSEQYRITNIRAGARQMQGRLIPPGASFSFNDTLGAVTAEQGFVEGLAIVDNRTQKEWGGGLCQVSTTVFRAAFWGGLPIAERHEHSFRISWYEELGEPPGLDAAIFTGVQDMRFVNDTGGWLLMQSYVDLERQRLTIALYGPPTGRDVALDYKILERIPAPTRPVYVNDPERPAGTIRKTDSARGGLRVDVYRTVSQNGRLIAQDTFDTLFKPWPDIYVRGTGRG